MDPCYATVWRCGSPYLPRLDFSRPLERRGVEQDELSKTMLLLHTHKAATRLLVSHGGSSTGRACYSSLQSKIKISSIPAPHAGSITIVSLNRPQARNAISTQMLSELSRIVDTVHSEGEKGSTRALIVTSEIDQAFCAGADLKQRLDFTPEEYAFVPVY